jgi:cellulose synthase/poly-beta-1,6-N-acetylglucosamine synthase-like glycosyltransferase
VAGATAGQPEGEHTGPRVSVVVPAFNRERFVGLTIDSVRRQTFRDWELVVFDDGSTDDTLAVARTFADGDRRIRVGHGPNGGVASARNRGLAMTDSTTEFVSFLDSDDLLEPEAIQTLVGELDNHPEYVAVHGLARCIDDDGTLVPNDTLPEHMRNRCAFQEGHVVGLQPHEPTTFGALVYQNCIVTPGTALIRRDVLRLVGEFDTTTDPCDDADLTIRASRHGGIGFVDRTLLRWRRHPDTLSHTSPRWRSAALRVRAKALVDLSNTPAQLGAARMAYLHSAAERRRAFWHSMREHDPREAFKDLLGAANLYEAYAVANLRLWWRRAAARVASRRGMVDQLGIGDRPLAAESRSDHP